MQTYSIEPMLAKVWEEHKHKLQYPVYVQPKLDGVRAIWNGHELVSRSKKTKFAVPHILNELRSKFHDVMLDGEIYCHGMGFDQISGLARRQTPQASALEFWVFDAPMNMETFSERIIVLNHLSTVRPAQHVRWTPTHIAKSEREVEDRMLEWTSGSNPYEGCMVRDASSVYVNGRTDCLLKYKRWHLTEAMVVGFEPGEGKHEGRLGALNCRLGNNTPIDVGTGFTDEERETIWSQKNNYLHKLVQVKYQELTKAGVPRFPVYIKVI